MKRPPLKKGDYHIVVSDSEKKFESEMKIFDANGVLKYTLPCLAKGQNADYKIPKGDTPPGIYRAGVMTVTKASEPKHIWNAFGKYFIDLEGLNSEEEKYSRSGVGIHGAGSGLPDSLAPYQKLLPTWGCIRMRNADLEKILVPLYQETRKTGNEIYVTVFQN